MHYKELKLSYFYLFSSINFLPIYFYVQSHLSGCQIVPLTRIKQAPKTWNNQSLKKNLRVSNSFLLLFHDKKWLKLEVEFLKSFRKRVWIQRAGLLSWYIQNVNNIILEIMKEYINAYFVMWRHKLFRSNQKKLNFVKEKFFKN